jgi:hypothetical protein
MDIRLNHRTSPCRLRYLREDDNVEVWTEHTDRINSKDLSDHLSTRYGKGKFRVSLRKDIYVIYIDIRESKNDEVSRAAESVNTTNRDKQNPFELELKQRIADFKLAEQRLKDDTERDIKEAQKKA